MNEPENSEMTKDKQASKIKEYCRRWDIQAAEMNRLEKKALDHYKLLISYSGKSHRNELEIDLRDPDGGIQNECALGDRIAQFLEMNFGLHHAQVLSMLVFYSLMKDGHGHHIANINMISDWIGHLHGIMNVCRCTIEEFFSDYGKYLPLVENDIETDVEDGEFLVETRTRVLDAVERGEITELPNVDIVYEAWKVWKARWTSPRLVGAP